MIFSKQSSLPLILGILTLQTLPVMAEPVKGEAEAIEMSDRDFRIAGLLHRIYEFAEQEEKAAEASAGEERAAHEKLPSANLKNSVRELSQLVDVPQFKIKLSQDLDGLKENLAPRHPQRRWVELLLNSLEKYGEAEE